MDSSPGSSVTRSVPVAVRPAAKRPREWKPQARVLFECRVHRVVVEWRWKMTTTGINFVILAVVAYGVVAYVM